MFLLNQMIMTFKLSAATGSLLLPSQVISGKRITTAELKGTANVSGINLSGTIDATATLIGFIPIGISGDLSGVINNLGVNVSVSENLGYFHKVNLMVRQHPYLYKHKI